MTQIVKVEKKKVLEPAEVISPSAIPRFEHMNYGITFRTWHPNVFMRRLGYTANPDTCLHTRKCYQPRFGWWCKDCGDSL